MVHHQPDQHQHRDEQKAAILCAVLRSHKSRVVTNPVITVASGKDGVAGRSPLSALAQRSPSKAWMWPSSTRTRTRAPTAGLQRHTGVAAAYAEAETERLAGLVPSLPIVMRC
jgi:hypothetical protein